MKLYFRTSICLGREADVKMGGWKTMHQHVKRVDMDVHFHSEEMKKFSRKFMGFKMIADL